MPPSVFDDDPHRKTRLFDSTVIREAQEGMEFMANVLEASLREVLQSEGELHNSGRETHEDHSPGR